MLCYSYVWYRTVSLSIVFMHTKRSTNTSPSIWKIDKSIITNALNLKFPICEEFSISYSTKMLTYIYIIILLFWQFNLPCKQSYWIVIAFYLQSESKPFEPNFKTNTKPDFQTAFQLPKNKSNRTQKIFKIKPNQTKIFWLNSIWFIRHHNY